jgi:hypothetical protein
VYERLVKDSPSSLVYILYMRFARRVSVSAAVVRPHGVAWPGDGRCRAWRRASAQRGKCSSERECRSTARRSCSSRQVRACRRGRRRVTAARCSDVWCSLLSCAVCAAQLEMYANRLPDVARKVLEVGRKKYPESVSFAVAALDLTIPTADDSSAWRGVLQRCDAVQG